MGQCLVDALSKESREYFGKRGWSGQDPGGGPPIWDSFFYQIRGKSTLEISSSFYGMNELARGDVPARDMVWLTQEAKEKNPARYALTKREKSLGMRKTGKMSKRERLPLVIPLEVNGQVEFRKAPLTIGDAWVHPGIAKFTFFEAAVRKGRQQMAQIIMAEVVRVISGG